MKKRMLILLQLFIAIVLICSNIYAVVDTIIKIAPSKTTLSRGETFSVKLSLENVNKKVVCVEGYINYDTSVFETLKYEDIQKDEDNTVTIGNDKLYVEDLTNATIDNMPSRSSYVGFNGKPDDGSQTRIVIDFDAGVSEDTDLLTINFKVKEDAKLDEVKNAISYSEFIITAGSEKSSKITEDIDVVIAAVSTEDEGPKDDGNTNSDNENTNTNTDNENENTNTDDKDNNTNTDDKDNNTNTDNENKNTNTDNENKNTNENNTNTNTNTNTKNENTNNSNNTNTNTKQNSTVNTNTNTNTVDKTVAEKNLPATGAKMIIIPAIVLIVLALVCYREYRKMNGI